jgi:hypothetical protein
MIILPRAGGHAGATAGLRAADGPTRLRHRPHRLDAHVADVEPAFEMPAQERQGPADREVDRRHRSEDQDRLEGHGVDLRTGAGEFGEADQRGERGALHDLDHVADRRRQGYADRLGHHHEPERAAKVEAERASGVPLAERHRLDAATPDLGKKGAGGEREGEDRGGPGVDPHPEQVDAEIEQKEQHQDGDGLHELDVARGKIPERPDRRDAHDRDEEAKRPAAEKGRERERDGPAGRAEKEPDLVEREGPEHLGLSSAPREGERVDRRECGAEAEHDRDVEGGHDRIDLEGAEGLRIDGVRCRGQLLGGDGRDDADPRVASTN